MTPALQLERIITIVLFIPCFVISTRSTYNGMLWPNCPQKERSYILWWSCSSFYQFLPQHSWFQHSLNLPFPVAATCVFGLAATHCKCACALANVWLHMSTIDWQDKTSYGAFSGGSVDCGSVVDLWQESHWPESVTGERRSHLRWIRSPWLLLYGDEEKDIKDHIL